MFGLLDCNNFYASCERVFRPELQNRPVIVLSNNDGCVIARSNEAKRLGIQMGTPVFRIRDLIKQEKIEVFSSNYTLYGDMSSRVMSMLRQEVPEIEVYSIDESFIDLSGIPDLAQFGRNLVRKISRGTGIPLSLGIAPTKTLAKTANKFAKKYKGYQGCCLIDTEEKRIRALQQTAIGGVWGIGRRLAAKLKTLGISDAYAFSRLPGRFIRQLMTVSGERLWRELNGQPCLLLQDNDDEEKKQICHSRSFYQAIFKIEDLRAAIAVHAARCAEKLRAQDAAAQAVMPFIQTNRFRPDLPCYANQKLISLPVAGNDTLEIVHAAVQGLQEIYRPGYAYKKCGVIIPSIIPAKSVQGDLFDRGNRLKSAALMQAIDKLNAKHPGSVELAVMCSSGRPELKKEFISANFTTDLNDIIVIKT